MSATIKYKITDFEYDVISLSYTVGCFPQLLKLLKKGATEKEVWALLRPYVERMEVFTGRETAEEDSEHNKAYFGQPGFGGSDA